jgi:hypothetical protein
LKGLFWIGVILTIVAPLIIGIHYKDPSTSWVAALCGAFITFISKWEEISELSLGPVKAKMKEKIEEAEKVLRQLREAVTVNAHATLTDLGAGSMSGGMRTDRRLEIHKNIISNLKEIDCTDEQVARAERDWKKVMNIYYCGFITQLVEERTSPHLKNFNTSGSRKKAYNELKELEDFGKWKMPSPEQIRSVLSRHSVQDEAVDGWVDDYEHYLETNEVRRVDEFIKLRDRS